jgi:hypothetical protein
MQIVTDNLTQEISFVERYFDNMAVSDVRENPNGVLSKLIFKAKVQKFMLDRFGFIHSSALNTFADIVGAPTIGTFDVNPNNLMSPTLSMKLVTEFYKQERKNIEEIEIESELLEGGKYQFVKATINDA